MEGEKKKKGADRLLIPKRHSNYKFKENYTNT